MDGIKYQLAVISDQLAVHAGVLFFWTGLQDGFLGPLQGAVWTGLQDSKIVVMCILEILSNFKESSCSSCYFFVRNNLNQIYSVIF